jgi:hypothetical protein
MNPFTASVRRAGRIHKDYTKSDVEVTPSRPKYYPFLYARRPFYFVAIAITCAKTDQLC